MEGFIEVFLFHIRNIYSHKYAQYTSVIIKGFASFDTFPSCS